MNLDKNSCFGACCVFITALLFILYTALKVFPIKNLDDKQMKAIIIFDFAIIGIVICIAIGSLYFLRI